MTADCNPLDVPEIRNYHRVIEGGRLIVRYLVRYPGETEWQEVELSRTSRPEDR